MLKVEEGILRDEYDGGVHILTLLEKTFLIRDNEQKVLHLVNNCKEDDFRLLKKGYSVDFLSDFEVIVSHDDLDGVCAAIVAKRANPNAEVIFTGNNSVDTNVLKNLGRKMILLDVSVSQEVAKKIDNDVDNTVIILDHHRNLEWLSEYPWAVITPGKSGTLLAFEFFFHYQDNIPDLVMLANDYDLWIHEYPHSKRLAMFLQAVGIQKFFEKFSKNISCIFNKEEEGILKQVQEEKEKTIEKHITSMVIQKMQGRKAGVFLGYAYAGETADEVSRRNIDIDVLIFVDEKLNKISFRTKSPDVDCSKIALAFGGNGHVKAAGCPLNVDMPISSIEDACQALRIKGITE